MEVKQCYFPSLNVPVGGSVSGQHISAGRLPPVPVQSSELNHRTCWVSTGIAAPLKDLEVHPPCQPGLPHVHRRISGWWSMAAPSTGSRGPGIYVILTSQVPEENGIQEAAKGEDHHGYQFTTLNSEGVFLSVSSGFLVGWKLNSLETESSLGFLLGRTWRQPFSSKDGARRLFLKLCSHGKHVCLGWEGGYGRWEGWGNPPPPCLQPSLSASTNGNRSGNCPYRMP